MSLPDGKSREEIFMDWISKLIRDYKAQGMTRQQVADKGQISRNQLYEWEGRGKKGFSRPKPDTLRSFCTGLGIDWHIPFRILGWSNVGAPTETPVESELVRRVRLIETALEQPGIAPERRRELQLMLMGARRLLDTVWDDLEDELGREA